MHKHDPKETFLVDAYLFGLSTMMTILFMYAGIHTFYLMMYHPVSGGAEAQLITAFFVGGLYILFFGALYIQSYNIWGRVRFFSDFFRLSAPLRRKILFFYSDIHHIVIDYSLESGEKLVWVVLSKTPIESRYTHKVNRMPLNSNQVRLLYSPELDAVLKRRLPQQALKQYSRCCSSLKIYGDNSTL
jgi:hypothetical protein